MDKTLFQEYSENQRLQMLQDNADKIENIGYMKSFSSDEISQMKDELAETSIKINEIEDEKKMANDGFKAQLKPLVIQKQTLLSNIKHKAEYVDERCYKIVDQEAGLVGYYNSQGILVSERSIRPEERQKTIFAAVREKTGTNN